MWIRNEEAFLDPDPNRIGNTKTGSGFRAVKKVQTRNNGDFELKRALTILLKAGWFSLEPGSPP